LLADLYIGMRELACANRDGSGCSGRSRNRGDWGVAEGIDDKKLVSLLNTIDARVTRVTVAGVQDWLNHAGEIAKRAVGAR
jgi:hypothetical protein